MCLGMFTVLDYVLLLARPAEPPPPSLCFFFKTPEISFRFLTASKAQELYRRAPSVSSELCKT